MGCPDANLLGAFAEGELSQSEREEIRHHARDCAQCRELLDDLGAEPETSAPTRSLGRGAPLEPRLTEDRLGRYLILAEIGAGGMGRVYQAYDPKLQREVAIKLLRVREEGGESEQRLVREAQAMAKLSHPNVVSVFDVDYANDSLFIAMEYVSGTTLQAWFEARSHGWPEVVALFCQAGEGLAAAHQAGLVHRDFKPANVMIGDDGRVRVMDFGLARGGRLEPDPSRQPEGVSRDVTQHGIVIGTPPYMAPEQFTGGADAKSDQFAFCVALYEGLFGKRPFPAGALAAVREAKRSGRFEIPAGRVPAFLETVVRRGLAPSPADRFESMGALLGALRHDPRARRRRIMGIGAALVLAAGGSVAYAQMPAGSSCRGATERVSAVWNDARKAEIEAALRGSGVAYADQTWPLLEGRLDAYVQAWASQWTEACEATHVRGEQSQRIWDRRQACLEGGYTEIAALSDELTGELDAATVEKAINAAAELPRLERCGDIEGLLDELAAPADPAVADQVAGVREKLAQAAVLERLGSYDTGLALVEGVREQVERLDYPPLLAEVEARRGTLLHQSGRYEDAAEALTRAHTIALGHGHDRVAAESAAQLVIIIGVRQAKLELGRVWAGQSEALVIRTGGDPEFRARHDGALGLLEFRAGRFERSRELQERALELTASLYGEDHPQRGNAMTNLASTLSFSGEIDLAHATYERARSLLEASLGPQHPSVASVVLNLGNLAHNAGDHETALEHYTRALEMREQSLPPDHPDIAAAINNVGVAYEKLERYEASEEYFSRALALKRASLGERHPDVAAALVNLASTRRAQGRLEDALQGFEQARSILESALGPDHASVGNVWDGIGATLLAMGRNEEAVRALENAVRILSDQGQPAVRAEAHFDLARALRRTSRPARASEVASIAIELYAELGDTGKQAEIQRWLDDSRPAG